MFDNIQSCGKQFGSFYQQGFIYKNDITYNQKTLSQTFSHGKHCLLQKTKKKLHTSITINNIAKWLLLWSNFGAIWLGYSEINQNEKIAVQTD